MRSSAANGSDAVVVTTMKAWDTSVTDKRAGQQKLVKALLATGQAGGRRGHARPL